MTGLFITFEGPDGCGKTTQLRRLAEMLQAQGCSIVVTREPGGTRISDQIRAMLLDPNHTEMADTAEVLLYAASRAQHAQEVILPALQAGQIVLCDRFVDASIAYQAYGLQIPLEEVEQVNRFATQGCRPNRTYLLDLPVEVSRERLLRRATAQSGEALDRIELKGQAYHERVRAGFQTLAEREPERIKVVNANQSIEEIFAEIQSDCQRLLKTLALQ